MMDVLREAIVARRAGRPDPVARPEAVAPYERRALTGSLAGVLDEVLGRAPAGSVPALAA
jgi:hypothetical protein